MSKENNHKQSGFTLIEMLVAITIFVVVLFTAAGTYIQVIKTQQTVIAKNRLIDDLRHTLDLMGRDIREGYLDFPIYTGSEYWGFGPPPPGLLWPTDELAITDINGDKIKYKYEPPVGDQPGAILRTKQNSEGDTTEHTKYLTKLTTDIVFFEFDIHPEHTYWRRESEYRCCTTLREHPRVTIFIKAEGKERIMGNALTNVNLQTTYSFRQYFTNY